MFPVDKERIVYSVRVYLFNLPRPETFDNVGVICKLSRYKFKKLKIIFFNFGFLMKINVCVHNFKLYTSEFFPNGENGYQDDSFYV